MSKPDFPHFIDSTIRKEFTMCPKRMHYSYVRHLKPKGSNIHLHFGGCFAKGLETVRKAYYGAGKSPMEALADGAQAVILDWGDYEADADSKKDLATCLVALYEYFTQYSLTEDTVRPLMFKGEPAVEFTFAVPIPGTKHPQTGNPILYGGRFDMLASYGNAVFVVDEKTASALGASWAKQWKLASQMTGYVWASKQFGYPVQGAIIRGVGILKNSITHQMCIETRPQWMLDRWLGQLQRDISRMIACWEEDVWDYDLDHSCGTYGGCAYLPLCESAEPEDWISTYYEYNPWNPLEKLEEKS